MSYVFAVLNTKKVLNPTVPSLQYEYWSYVNMNIRDKQRRVEEKMTHQRLKQRIKR